MSCKLCKEGLNIFENQCKGLHLSKIESNVIIDKDSCYGDSVKVVYRRKSMFPDDSFLVYDEVLMCADKKLLIEIANAIKREFD